MAIIEISGGPITHRYLMGKTKDEIATMYMRLLRMTDQDTKDAERYRFLRNCEGTSRVATECKDGKATVFLPVNGKDADSIVDGEMARSTHNTCLGPASSG